MPNVIRYTCREEHWTALEAALASHGYAIDIPLQHSGSGASAMIMKRGAVSLLFTRRPSSNLFTVELWGEARDIGMQLLESLPFRLSKPLDAPLQERTA
jgi:hypothetical protein